MKKILLFFSLGFAMQAAAQAPFLDRDSINANNINALTLVHGDMWWNPPGGLPHCKFPNGTNKNIEFATTLWMSGYDAAGQLHVAAQTYRQSGNDYWPGPLDGGGNLDYSTSSEWAKVWKVTRAEINTFRSIPTLAHTVANTPPSILTWPGANSAYAKGKGGATLTVASDMAPFVDRNGNGIYEPLNGDYPDFNGEQVLWWVFSDNGPTHTQSHGVPLKVEVHAMAYAFKRNTLIDNVVYYDYTIINKSTENYHDFRWALSRRSYLGYYLDDYLGFDSGRRMAIVYNATNDDGGSAGHPDNSYGANTPVVGVTIVRLPGDVGASYTPAGSFIYFNNDPSIMGNPAADTEYNHYMRARIRNGTHFQYGGQDRNYYATDDPSMVGGWSECSLFVYPVVRTNVLASNDFTLNAGSKQRVVMALVVDSIGGGCPNVNFNRIKIVADTAWAAYHSLPNGIATQNANSGNDILIYPNPAHDKLIIDCGTSHEDVQVSVYNMVGQRVGNALCRRSLKNTVDISSYPAGVYVVSYLQGGVDKKMMFVKQ